MGLRTIQKGFLRFNSMLICTGNRQIISTKQYEVQHRLNISFLNALVYFSYINLSSPAIFFSFSQYLLENKYAILQMTIDAKTLETKQLHIKRRAYNSKDNMQKNVQQKYCNRSECFMRKIYFLNYNQ